MIIVAYILLLMAVVTLCRVSFKMNFWSTQAVLWASSMFLGIAMGLIEFGQ